MDSGLPATNDGIYTLGYDYGKQEVAKLPYTANWLDMKHLEAGNCVAGVM